MQMDYWECPLCESVITSIGFDDDVGPVCPRCHNRVNLAVDIIRERKRKDFFMLIGLIVFLLIVLSLLIFI